MENRSRDRMRVDRRLLERSGWITPEELERELAALPDVADKIDSRESDPSGDEASPPDDPAETTPSALGPDFNSGRHGEDSGGGFSPSS